MILGIIRGQLIGDSHAIDAVVIGNGILAGLVSITAGSDIIHGDHSLVVGAGGAVAYMLGSAMCEWCHLDDIVEAWPVHGCCGIWGTLAVGIFHPDLGLWTTGQSELLVTQCIGIGCIFMLTMLTVTPLCLVLSNSGYLRVKAEEEARGLDYKFGNAASTYIMSKNQRLRACFLTLDAYGFTIAEVLAALKSLRNVIMLSFSPQGSDNLIEGQVADALSRLDPCSKDKSFMAFLSHHKADAGDAARIFVDTARRLCEPTAKSSSNLGEVGRQAASGEGGSTKIFLDSNDLTNLKKLIAHVHDSENHVLMLTRAALERPYVLCELVYAWKQKKKIISVRVNWPGDAADPAQAKAFGFPEHLDEAIADWEDVAYFQRARTIESDMTYRPLDGFFRSCREVFTPIIRWMRGYSADTPGETASQGTSLVALCASAFDWLKQPSMPRSPNGGAFQPLEETVSSAEIAIADGGADVSGTNTQQVGGVTVPSTFTPAIVAAPVATPTAQKGSRRPSAAAMFGMGSKRAADKGASLEA